MCARTRLRDYQITVRGRARVSHRSNRNVRAHTHVRFVRTVQHNEPPANTADWWLVYGNRRADAAIRRGGPRCVPIVSVRRTFLVVRKRLTGAREHIYQRARRTYIYRCEPDASVELSSRVCADRGRVLAGSYQGDARFI